MVLTEQDLELIYEQYLLLLEGLREKLPPEMIEKIAKIHFQQIHPEPIDAAHLVLWLGSEEFIHEYLRMHYFTPDELSKIFYGLAFRCTDRFIYSNGFREGVTKYFLKNEWKLRLLINKGADPLAMSEYDDTSFTAALEHGNIIFCKWLLQFAPQSSIRDQLRQMDEKSFLIALADKELWPMLGLPANDKIESALLDAYESQGLDSCELAESWW